MAALGWTPMAFATHYEATLEGSIFQIDDDANLRVDPSEEATLDWANVTQINKDDAPTGRDDDSYSGGTKEDTVCPGQTTGSIPNNKSDLLSFGVYEEAGDPGFLHLYWSRVNEPSGTTLMDFEFNQSEEDCAQGPNKTRTEGDLLLEYAIDQGGARAEIYLREWTGSDWGPARNIADPDPVTGEVYATGTINQSTIPEGESDGLGEMSPRTFGEASIDLDVIFDEGSCSSFGSAMLKSRASDSFTSQLKDFVAPVGITLTNCGQVKITKETAPAGDGPDFSFSKTFDTDPSSTNRDDFSLGDGETETFLGVLFGTGYTVTENELPAGWSFDRIDCDASSAGVSYAIADRTVTFDILDEDDVLDCTFYNEALADLTIVKQVTDDPGGQTFGFTSTSLAPAAFDLTPTATGEAGEDSREFSGIATGTYDVDETVPAGWNLTSATCDNGDEPDAVTVGAGDAVTCTFVNARERGAIEITKTRKHAAAEGGEDAHAGVDFAVTSDDYPEVDLTVTTGADGTACVPDLLFGDYTVTETVPNGYVSEDAEQDVAVVAEAGCGEDIAAAADVSFVNTPLTDVTVTVDSQVDGGTASTISCVDGEGALVEEDLTNAPGDVELAIEDLEPTAPAATLVCTIVVDP
ncbi:MSCRAMM family protein [Ornithinimicrobium sediminis]|uniref:MSCRAMM family protein n=1 Tax=Ornithinimicrobium sediminis TaxID=2904603 RepID=UPI001E60FB1C|nr:SpaA isopeptide-forming pilin-related protein [Ornithinimicrobium sediminis]MCE0487625.1 prealbumin-like fold domain-containing protein [Ornithinimicrobium sediminis]